jgi:hypothetical protein
MQRFTLWRKRDGVIAFAILILLAAIGLFVFWIVGVAAYNQSAPNIPT